MSQGATGPRRHRLTVADARHGIPEVWLVDLKGKRLVRYRNPQQGAYTLIDQPDLALPLEIAALPEARLDLSTLFG